MINDFDFQLNEKRKEEDAASKEEPCANGTKKLYTINI